MDWVKTLMFVSMGLNVVAATLNGIAFKRNIKLRKLLESLIEENSLSKNLRDRDE